MMQPNVVEIEDKNVVIGRIASGDAQAFAQIVDTHARILHRIAYRMLGDPSGAEDVAQEALLRFWKQASGWRGDGPGVGAWLRRVTTNLCLDQLRRKKFASDEEVPERADPSLLADQELEQHELRSALLQAMRKLNDRQRAAIVLTYYEALPNGAAAEALEMNVKAFESLLLRARAALKQALNESGLIQAQDVRDLS